MKARAMLIGTLMAIGAQGFGAQITYTASQIPGVVHAQDFVSGINNSGQVAGTILNFSTDSYNAFLYSNGVTTNIAGELGAHETITTGINGNGQIIGTYGQILAAQSGFLLSGNTVQNLGVNANPTSINDLGQVLVSVSSSQGNLQYFIYQNGVFNPVGELSNSMQVSPLFINNSGQLAGNAESTSGSTQAFLYSGGKLTLEGSLNGSYSQSYALNNKGQIAGVSINTSGFDEAILITDGTIQALGALPGGLASLARSVNDSGEVVGWSTTATGFDHAFVYTAGQLFDLNDLVTGGVPSGFFLADAESVNDNGVILANAYDPTTGSSEYEILQPNNAAPEPTSFACFALGAAAALTNWARTNGRSLKRNRSSDE
jgi:probable HAF family extracellular repeat protein